MAATRRTDRRRSRPVAALRADLAPIGAGVGGRRSVHHLAVPRLAPSTAGARAVAAADTPVDARTPTSSAPVSNIATPSGSICNARTGGSAGSSPQHSSRQRSPSPEGSSRSRSCASPTAARAEARRRPTGGRDREPQPGRTPAGRERGRSRRAARRRSQPARARARDGRHDRHGVAHAAGGPTGPRRRR